MPSKPQKDLVEEARELLAKIPSGMAMPNAPLLSKSLLLLRQLVDEVESLRRGEFICQRCHLRKDAEFERGDF